MIELSFCEQEEAKRGEKGRNSASRRNMAPKCCDVVML